MRRLVSTTVALSALTALPSTDAIAVSGVNYRYFDFRNKTVALVGSTEHYGAVLNLDFDYITYLDTLAAAGLHLTRTWTGVIYREDLHSFNIRRNTLAPLPGRYIAPWAVSAACCYNATPGVPMYNLTGFNSSYFDRLKGFVSAAGARGIVVNLGLHSNFYGADSVQWALSPLHPSNNVNGVGGDVVSANDVFVLGAHPDITALLDAYVGQAVAALAGLDNVYFEVINELWTYDAGGEAYRPWVDHTIALLDELGGALGGGGRALVSENYALMARRVGGAGVNPRTDMYSFHDTTLDCVLVNEGGDGVRYVRKPLGTGETGFTGDPWAPSLAFHSDAAYRSEGWLVMLGGGATYANLDYSFSTLFPNGTDLPIPDFVPGGGGPALRASLGGLQALLDSLPLAYVTPQRSLLSALVVNGRPQMQTKWSMLGAVTPSLGVLALYVTDAWWVNGTANGTMDVEVTLPALPSVSDAWQVEWVEPSTGTRGAPVGLTADTYGRLALTTPAFTLDVACVLTRVGGGAGLAQGGEPQYTDVRAERTSPVAGAEGGGGRGRHTR